MEKPESKVILSNVEALRVESVDSRVVTIELCELHIVGEHGAGQLVVLSYLLDQLVHLILHEFPISKQRVQLLLCFLLLRCTGRRLVVALVRGNFISK